MPQGGTIVVGEWQRATQLNPYLSNALRDSEANRIFQRSLATVNDQGEFVPDCWPSSRPPRTVAWSSTRTARASRSTCSCSTAWPGRTATPLTLHDYKWNYDWAAMIGASGEVGCPYCAQLVPLKDPSITGAEGFDPSNQRVDSFEVSEDGLTASIHFARTSPAG